MSPFVRRRAEWRLENELPTLTQISPFITLALPQNTPGRDSSEKWDLAPEKLATISGMGKRLGYYLGGFGVGTLIALAFVNAG